jgi:hypothetical protein
MFLFPAIIGVIFRLYHQRAARFSDIKWLIYYTLIVTAGILCFVCKINADTTDVSALRGVMHAEARRLI